MKTFWEFVREREAIRKRRAAGRRPPWTDDEVMRTHSFTNVFRTDDPDTAASLRFISERSRTPWEWLWRAYAFRSLNRVATFERFGMPRPRGFRAWQRKLNAARVDGVAIGSPAHLTFWSHAQLALERLDSAIARRVHRASSGIEAVKILNAARPTLYVGPYLGTLIVSDLALSDWGGAFGPDTTVPVANGARVGLEIASGTKPRAAHHLFDEHGTASRRARSMRAGTDPAIVDRVATLAAESFGESGLRLTFIDVENCLCEYSRYARIAAGLVGPWQRRLRR